MNRITTLHALQSLQDQTYVYAIITLVIAIGLSIIIANMIPFKSDGKSYIARRIWFVVVGLLAPISFYLYNDLSVKINISNVGWQSMFVDTMLYATLIIFGGYIVLGLFLMLILPNAKFKSILGKVKK